MRTKTLLASIFLYVISLFLFENTNLDIELQNTLFDFNHKLWHINNMPQLHLILYKGPKYLCIFLGIIFAMLTIYSYKKNTFTDYRKSFLIVTLSIVFIPLLCWIGKLITHVDCPWDLNLYTGSRPYIKLFSTLPDALREKPGQCYPGGHASGGFSFLSVFLVPKSLKLKIFFTTLAFLFGASMATYQIMRGAHFISHQIATFLFSLIFISALNLII